MIKNKLKSQKAISLVSLAISIVIIMIIANIVIYNIEDNLQVTSLEKLRNDIGNLREKVASYYLKNGEIPAKLEYNNVEYIKQAGIVSTEVDTGNFYVIDLQLLDNLTLNYGRDYEEIKTREILGNEASQFTDVYIINETSHNIFYVAGIEIQGDVYYTDYTSEDVDTKAVDLKYVDNVKIPDGFYYVGGTKKEGLVISDEKDDDMQNSKHGNQFVWVPVENISEMAKKTTGTDSNGNSNYQGKLYKYTESTESGKPSKSVENPNSSESALYGQGSTSYREPSLITGDTNVTKALYETDAEISGTEYDVLNQNYSTALGYGSAREFGEAMQKDYNSMIKSVQKYKGFYVGRYEMSLGESTDEEQSGKIAQSKGNEESVTVSDIDSKNWYWLYNNAKTYTSTENSVVSGMIWGSQYDAMLNWMQKNGVDVTSKTAGGASKNSSQVTGSSNTDKINNIYDLLGANSEWTLEAYDTNTRIRRGGYYNDDNSPSYRVIVNGNPNNTSNSYVSTRLALYII